MSSFLKLTEAHQLLTGAPTQRIESTEWGRMLTEIRDGRTKGVLRVVEGGKETASA